ncbi:hypothetical protein [Flaviaesturariibacter terrae]
MADNIPYIHNYCDRCCERCPLTARCAVFEMNQDLPPEAEDPENEAFWQTIASRLAGSLRMLQEGAAGHGIVLSEPDSDEYAAYAQQQEELRARIDACPLVQAARRYGDTVELLFTHSGLWERKGRELAQETTLGIKSVGTSMSEVELLADCRHVLGWYQHFIEIKFRRALHGLWDDDEEALEPQSDANGSAKIALIAVDRSRLALTSLLRLAGEDDTVLDLLALLEVIGREGRALFPGADGFRRPGFDDIPDHQN